MLLILQVKCVGQRPNSKLIQALSLESISETGHVKVRPTLQLADTSLNHIYAAGDVVDMDNIKNGRAAVQQAQSVAQNIVRSIKSQNQLEYRPQWWEGMTKLHVGLVSSFSVSASDHIQADTNIGESRGLDG